MSISKTMQPEMMRADLTMNLLLEQPAILGECLVWRVADQSWWWTDIESSAMHCWTPGSDALSTWRMPDRVASFAHCESGRILVGMAKWLAFTAQTVDATLASGAAEMPAQPVAAVDPAEARTRINDGRTDRAGNFVFGTMNEAQEKRPVASFYQYSMQHGLRRLALPAVAIANSICFSPDGLTMYFTDTLTRKIMQCDYESATAQVSRIRLFADLATADLNGAAHAYPDGSIIDRDGCLWNAQWGAAQVVQYDLQGTALRRIRVPVKNPTCPALGGTGLNVLTVSSSRQEMSSEELRTTPTAGSLFSITLAEVTGLPDALFNDQVTEVNATKNNRYVKMRR